MEIQPDHPIASLAGARSWWEKSSPSPPKGFPAQPGVSWPLPCHHPFLPKTPRSVAHMGPRAGVPALSLFPKFGWGSGLGTWGHPWPTGELSVGPKERVALPKAGALGLPRALPPVLQSSIHTPSVRTPHGGAATLPSQLPAGAPYGNPPARPGSCPVPSTGVLVPRTKARRPLPNRERLKAAAFKAC